jgi:hypothetical protein
VDSRSVINALTRTQNVMIGSADLAHALGDNVCRVAPAGHSHPVPGLAVQSEATRNKATSLEKPIAPQFRHGDSSFVWIPELRFRSTSGRTVCWNRPAATGSGARGIRETATNPLALLPDRVAGQPESARARPLGFSRYAQAASAGARGPCGAN